MRKFSRHLQSGFTLIEVMVVVAIIGILALVIVPNVVGKYDQARVTTTKASLSSVANALELYKLDNYRYPTTEEGLDALVRRPASARPASGAPCGPEPKARGRRRACPAPPRCPIRGPARIRADACAGAAPPGPDPGAGPCATASP